MSDMMFGPYGPYARVGFGGPTSAVTGTTQPATTGRRGKRPLLPLVAPQAPQAPQAAQPPAFRIPAPFQAGAAHPPPFVGGTLPNGNPFPGHAAPPPFTGVLPNGRPFPPLGQPGQQPVAPGTNPVSAQPVEGGEQEHPLVTLARTIAQGAMQRALAGRAGR